MILSHKSKCVRQLNKLIAGIHTRHFAWYISKGPKAPSAACFAAQNATCYPTGCEGSHSPFPQLFIYVCLLFTMSSEMFSNYCSLKTHNLKRRFHHFSWNKSDSWTLPHASEIRRASEICSGYAGYVHEKWSLRAETNHHNWPEEWGPTFKNDDLRTCALGGSLPMLSCDFTCKAENIVWKG